MTVAIAFLLSAVLFLPPPTGAQAQRSQLRGRIVDTSHLPLPGVTVTLAPAPPATGTPVVTTTDGIGQYQFDAAPGRYTLTAQLSGFQTVVRPDISIGGEPIVIDLELPLAPFTQETQVVAQVPRVMSSGEPTAPSTLDKDVIKIAPVQGLRYDSALPLLPTAVRGPDGLISIGGARTTQGSVLVDRLRENDPVSGEPAITVPIAAIDSVQVFAPGPPADAGPGTSGVTLVNSRRGADAYGFTLSTFVPRPRFGGGPSAINGIESWQPNFGISGPIVRSRAWFNEAIEYRWERFQNETAVGRQDTRLKAFSSFTRADIAISEHQFVTGRLAVDPENRQHYGLDAFAPANTVPNLSSRPISAAVTTRIDLGADSLEVGFHAKRRRLRVLPVADTPYSIAHDIARGGFFRTVDRTADRFELGASWTGHEVAWHGRHVFRGGASFGRATVDGSITSRPVEYLRSDSTIATRVEFIGPGLLDASAADAGVYVQDSWTVHKGLNVDAGARFDYAGALSGGVAGPRAAASYALDEKTKVTAGTGIFPAKPTLNVAVFEQRQARRITTFDASGQPIGLPQTLSGAVTDDLALARATVVYAQVDRTIGRSWQIRVGAQQRRGSRELVVNPLPGANGEGVFALTGHGTSRARSLEVTTGYRSSSATRQFYVSYVRSSSIGNLNDVNAVTGPSAAALVLPDARGPLPANVPHRFLAWGIVSLPWHLTVAPFLEIRSGFPFSPIDDDWNPVGPRNGARFPVFASADLAIEKALKVPKLPPMRLGLKFFNVTGRNNGRNIQADVARPDYGQTFNPIRRQFRFSMEIVWSRM